MQADVKESDENARATAWLSRGLEALVGDRPWMAGLNVGRPPDFDVVIVGSGYGASVAAAELAGCTNAEGQTISVCVLERGKEYLAGMFPSRMADLAGHARFATPEATKPRGVRDGLFDIRTSGDAVALVANGLGGGSLINAGVMEMPLDSVFREVRWPQAIRNDAALSGISRELLKTLGADKLTKTNALNQLAKTNVLRQLAGADRFDFTPITVALEPGENSAGVILDECIGCGDCATGCNHNAKESLDLTLLRSAFNAGAKIYTGATVLRLERGNSGAQDYWVVVLNHTDGHLRDRQPLPFRLRARRVILAAGTLGSTEILMRSRSLDLQFSTQLGRKFSANGDMISVAHDLVPKVNAVANERIAPDKRKIGPTITAMIDRRSDDAATSVVIQDLAVPGPLRRLFEEAVTTSDVLNRLADGDCATHGGPRPDDAAVNARATKRSLVVAMIGRDDADGELRWGADPGEDGDGLLTVLWPALRSDARFAEHHRRLGEALKDAQLGGKVIENPMWRPLSERLEGVFGSQRGPLLTVHPLGGCAMGNDVTHGVTDDLGRVYDAGADSPVARHEGLVVLDGSIIPTSLGINPSLTIATLAKRGVRALKSEWGFKAHQGGSNPVERRPVFRIPETNRHPTPTAVEMTEQMVGPVLLRGADGKLDEHWIEMTLTTEPARLDKLMERFAPFTGRQLEIKPNKGRLRILTKAPDPVTGRSGPGEVELEAEIEGAIKIFALERSCPVFRTLRALWAWVLNRGLRDLVQSFAKDAVAVPRLEYFIDILRLGSRAGAVRLLEYGLTIGKVLPVQDGETTRAVTFNPAQFSGQSIRGVKRLTYARCASPWTQLMELELEAFPGLAPHAAARTTLTLNPRYLAHQQVPLLRIVHQQDRVAALVDLLSFVLYAARIVLQVHALSFRKPDAPSKRPALRLPGEVQGLPVPEIKWVSVPSSSGPPARIRLARYFDRAKAAAMDATVEPPVLLIHGYSASGTTYAHHAVPDGLAKTLCDRGRDVWILDMRSSSGMPTARGNWAFEEMASYDIPIAIEHVLQSDTQAERVDVVAHCMGSAMFGMAVLVDSEPTIGDKKLHERIGRLVMSQIGPVMVLSPANVLRAYVMRYVRQFLQLEDYEFTPEGEDSLAGQLLDRVLATLPLPKDEYERENPFWPPGQFTPWVGTRHRIDALYARTFSLANLSDRVLDCIDDFFGPLSIETVSQVIHFARFKTVTDKQGVNRYVSPQRIAERLTFPMLSIHGEKNGLSDVATLALMRKTLRGARIPCLNPGAASAVSGQTPSKMHERIKTARTCLNTGSASFMSWRIPNHGHQDTLIGTHAGDNCKVIADFLSRRPEERR